MEQEYPRAQKMLDYLKDPTIQGALQTSLSLISTEVLTGIGQAAKITGLSPTQLRYWEGKRKALLTPQRTHATDHTSSQQKEQSQGQRLYSLQDLKRLIIIKKLLDGPFSLVDLADLDIASLIEQAEDFLEREAEKEKKSVKADVVSIHERIIQTERSPFWQYFIPRALYLALCLAFEGKPEGDTGIFLPLEWSEDAPPITSPENLRHLGKTLLGWHQRNDPFYTFLYEKGIAPDYPGSFALLSLDKLLPSQYLTNTYIVAERKIAQLIRNRKESLRTAQRLLHFIQQKSAIWMSVLEQGDHYLVYHAPVFFTSGHGDPLLREMAEAVVDLGGTTTRAGVQVPRWRFCCFLRPEDPFVPVHKRKLIIVAQSAQSPYQHGESNLVSDPQTSLSLRAYQSGQIMYRSSITSEETVIARRELEEPIHSAIAVPIIDGDGQPEAVLYIVSEEEHAFSEEDRLLLRTIERMVSELVLSYDARQLLVKDLNHIIRQPTIVDRFFEEFVTENAFIERLETLLAQVRNNKQSNMNTLSFIAIDVDNFSTIVEKYGLGATKDLIRGVGKRILGQTRVLSKRPEDILLYRIYGDRFYLMLRDIPREKAIALSRELHRSLKHPYQLNVSSSILELNPPGDNLLRVENITVRLGVTSYSLTMLNSLLEQDPEVANVRAKMTRALDEALELGKGRGGNSIFAWDPTYGLIPLPEDA